MRPTEREILDAKRSFKAYSLLSEKKKVDSLKNYLGKLQKEELKRLSSLLEILVLKDKIKKISSR